MKQKEEIFLDVLCKHSSSVCLFVHKEAYLINKETLNAIEFLYECRFCVRLSR